MVGTDRPIANLVAGEGTVGKDRRGQAADGDAGRIKGAGQAGERDVGQGGPVPVPTVFERAQRVGHGTERLPWGQGCKRDPAARRADGDLEPAGFAVECTGPEIDGVIELTAHHVNRRVGPGRPDLGSGRRGVVKGEAELVVAGGGGSPVIQATLITDRVPTGAASDEGQIPKEASITIATHSHPTANVSPDLSVLRENRRLRPYQRPCLNFMTSATRAFRNPYRK